ncbi:protein takeout-like [Haematobia irritans]|uniref:protein takeout-like n=1 Tax=Haematobia irritans TaxID=7368 RepID=UPI003F5076C5
MNISVGNTSIIFGVIICSISLVESVKYLSEKPSFLNICQVNDSNSGTCFAKNLEQFFAQWKSGIPGLKSVRSLDPIHVKRLRIEQGGDGPFVVNIELQNADISGLSKSIFTDNGSDVSKLKMKFKVDIPSFKVTGDYNLQGRALQLALNGSGKATITVEKAVATLTFQFVKRKEGDLVFGELQNFHFQIDDAGLLQIHFGNLFNGDKALEDSAHVLLNANWRSLFDIGLPGINQAVVVIMKDYFLKIFKYVPISYLLDGVDE